MDIPDREEKLLVEQINVSKMSEIAAVKFGGKAMSRRLRSFLTWHDRHAFSPLSQAFAGRKMAKIQIDLIYVGSYIAGLR
ncbi:unnamed protein product [marine sediment metagenome]|uniref:Uncharacterized protein n=1 Tax=marine sediment metagenome TaxID=412755 RepID=X1E4A1_9ZZZZ